MTVLYNGLYHGIYTSIVTVIEMLTALLMVLIGFLPAAVAEPFSYLFMQRALMTSLVVGTVCGVLSCFVVLKRWALLGDAISHAVLPGVALAYLAGIPVIVGAFLSGALTSLGIGFVQRNTSIKEDSAMGLMFTASFALGVVIISRIATSTHLMHVLFGNVLGVDMPMLATTFTAGFIALVLVSFFYKEFVLYAFDAVHASAIGLSTTAIHYGLMLLLTLTIVTSLETVGVILVVAMLIVPGATASLLTRHLPSMIAISVAVGVTSATVGLYLSFVMNVASGGTIVLVGFCLFVVAALVAPAGPLRSWLRRARTAPGVPA